MADYDDILESMQADILGILQGTPSLKGHVMRDNDGDFESRLERSLGTKTAGSGGKRGLAVIVLQVEVVQAEKNLPGPPLQLRARVLVIENIRINRSAAKGTLQKSSQAALNILATLHLAGFGAYSLYADKDPVSPQTVPEGLQSHMVTLQCLIHSLGIAEKPRAVSAEMEAGALVLTCPTEASEIRYTTDGSYPASSSNLYTAPIEDLATGTLVRAAAYVVDQPPSDVLELTITD
jgi:hypothetical protein